MRMFHNLAVCSVLLLISVFAACNKPGKLYVNGDSASIGAEVYIDNVKAGVLTKVSIADTGSKDVKVGSHSSSSNLKYYGAGATFNIVNGRHYITIIATNKKQISKVIKQNGEGYVYVDFKQMTVVDGDE